MLVYRGAFGRDERDCWHDACRVNHVRNTGHGVRNIKMCPVSFGVAGTLPDVLPLRIS